MEKSEIGPEAFNQKVVELRGQMKLGGGEKRIEAQHCKGKKTARERVEELLDAGSFQEIDGFMKMLDCYEMVEFCRTGVTGIHRGVREYTRFED